MKQRILQSDNTAIDVDVSPERPPEPVTPVYMAAVMLASLKPGARFGIWRSGVGQWASYMRDVPSWGWNASTYRIEPNDPAPHSAEWVNQLPEGTEVWNTKHELTTTWTRGNKCWNSGPACAATLVGDGWYIVGTREWLMEIAKRWPERLATNSRPLPYGAIAINALAASQIDWPDGWTLSQDRKDDAGQPVKLRVLWDRPEDVPHPRPEFRLIGVHDISIFGGVNRNGIIINDRVVLWQHLDAWQQTADGGRTWAACDKDPTP